MPTAYPKGHEEHMLYISYYESIGMSREEAEASCYFTINAAPAESIYWMTDEDIKRFGILE